MNETELTDSYNEFLLERLRDPAQATAYLNAALADEHEETLLLALRDVATACHLCDRIASAFASHGVSEADLSASLPKARRRVFERHYPKLAQAEKTRTSRNGKKKME